MLLYLLLIYHNVLSDQESANYWGKFRELKLSLVVLEGPKSGLHLTISKENRVTHIVE